MGRLPDSPMKLWRLTNGQPDPTEFPYPIVQMYRRNVMSPEGFLVAAYYHADPERTDLVLSVHVEYLIGADSESDSRTTLRKWYREDGTVGAQRYTEKVYFADILEDVQARQGASQRRRKNVIDALKVKVAVILIMAGIVPDQAAAAQVGTAMMRSHSNEVTDYTANGDTMLATMLIDDVTPWLQIPVAPGVTLAQMMVAAIQSLAPGLVVGESGSYIPEVQQ